jgi:hypothetical protein
MIKNKQIVGLSFNIIFKNVVPKQNITSMKDMFYEFVKITNRDVTLYLFGNKLVL